IIPTLSLFFLMIPPLPISTLFPYTTLFRSIVLTILPLLFVGCTVGPKYVKPQVPLPPIDAYKELNGWKIAQPNDQTIKGKWWKRSEEHTSELQSRFDLVCRLLLEQKKHSDD